MGDDTPAVIFLSRTFPPSTGGMQQFSHHLHAELQRRDDVELLSKTYGGSKKWLPLMLPYFWLWTLIQLIQRDIDCIYMTDGLLSPIGTSFRPLFGMATVITVHGLDITFDNWVYQRLVVPTFQYHDKVVAVSDATAETARAAGVPDDTLTVIPNGVDPDEFYAPATTRDDLEQRLHAEIGVDIDTASKTVLLSVGRLVERKGFHWFVDNVMPKLGTEYVYLLCGSGSYSSIINERIHENGLDGRVFLLGRVSGELLRTCYNTADMLIMPNIPVDGDMEGFGLVAVEASSCGTPVIAADMEGMQDAVIDGKTGIHAPVKDAGAFHDAVKELATDTMNREAVRQTTINTFAWNQRTASYVDVFNAIC